MILCDIRNCSVNVGGLSFRPLPKKLTLNQCDRVRQESVAEAASTWTRQNLPIDEINDRLYARRVTSIRRRPRLIFALLLGLVIGD
jgi:hypothetical protein